MRRTVTSLCLAAVFGFGAGTFAQQPGAGAPARNDGVTTPNDFEQTRRASSGPDTFSLTGCLDRRNDGTYELRNAHMNPIGTDTIPGKPGTGTTSSATGTSGPSSAAKAPVDSTASDWILKSTTDLAPHVGHSVEVTGRMSAPTGTGSDSATTANPTTTATGARIKKPGEDAKSVDVESVRMISRSCS
jgi:hypothetical protein